MATKNSFRDPITGVLKSYGFMAANAPGDIVMGVDDGFALNPGDWYWNGAQWLAYTRPPTQDQQDATAAKTDTAVSALAGMTPTQARTWVQNNVNTLADAKSLLGTLAAVLCVLARRL